MNIKRKFNELRRCIYGILDAPHRLGPQIAAKIDQNLKIDDSVLRHQENDGHQIVIVQSANQTLYTQINNHSVKALEALDNLEDNYFVVSGIENALKKCLMAGEPWPQLQERIKSMYFKMAMDNHKTMKEAARQLGIGRTTITEHFRRREKIEAINTEGEDE